MSKKKKPTGGKHSTPRRPVQFPVEWLAVAKRIASHQKMPVLWVMIEMLKAKAEELGTEELGIEDMPSVPWEDTAE